MSIFVGNVSKNVTHQQFEDTFKAYGNCKIDLRKRYAFIQYESERSAEAAKNALQNVNYSGLRLNIEWSKNSGRFNENNRSKNDRSGIRRRRSNSRDRSWRRDDRMYKHSPSSYEKRVTPSYSENEDDIETFVSRSPRDNELLRRLREKREEGEMVQDRHHRKNEHMSQAKMELEAGEAI